MSQCSTKSTHAWAPEQWSGSGVMSARDNGRYRCGALSRRQPCDQEGRMRKSEQVTSWAVYEVNTPGKQGPRAVCTQAEWEQMERGDPGSYRLVKGGITNEGEAERLARAPSDE